MAKKTITVIEDDLADGAPIPQGEERVFRFSVEGIDYALDTSADNYDAAKDRSLNELVAIANSVGGRVGARRGRGGKKQQGPSTAEVRAWAQENGYSVSDRGRIPADVLTAYEAAH